MPLEPYPARSARHLPLEGKALSVVILCSTYPVFALTMREKRHPRFAAFPIAKGVVSREAMLSYRSLPHWGRGTAPAVDRVLSYIVNLRQSFPLFFIPLVPYPARFARHLPHAGKALSVGIVFPHISCIRSDDARKAVLSYRSLPPRGRETAPAALGYSRKRRT